MSRGFVKEDDQEEAPFIPPRAPLPDGVTNYVTPRGRQLLEEERQALEKERHAILERSRSGEIGDDERRRDLAVVNGKLDLLGERIATAQMVELDRSTGTVRFGTTVTFSQGSGSLQKQSTFTIVGVDEADVKIGRIAFTAPIARALIGKSVGEIAEFRLGDRSQELRIIDIRLEQ